MRNSETSFNVGLSDRNYSEITDTPQAEEPDLSSTGWSVSSNEVPESLAEIAGDDGFKLGSPESVAAHEKRLERLTSKKHVAVLKTVVAALSEGTDKQRKAAKEIYWTNSIPVVACSKPGGDVDVIAGVCRHRLNPVQMLETKACAQFKYTAVVEEAQRLRPQARFSLITLTLRHWQELPLETSLDVLNLAFGDLTKSALWKRTVKHYVRGVETTWSADSGWHAHIHAFAECGFFELEELHALWCDRVEKAALKVQRKQVDRLMNWNESTGPRPYLLATADFSRLLPTLEGVDLKGASNPAEAVGYVAKMDLIAALEHEQIRELDLALKGRMLIRASKHWGSRAKALEKERNEQARDEELEQGVERITFRDLNDDLVYGERMETAERISKACYSLGFKRMAALIASVLLGVRKYGPKQRVEKERRKMQELEPEEELRRIRAGARRRDRARRHSEQKRFYEARIRPILAKYDRDPLEKHKLVNAE